MKRILIFSVAYQPFVGGAEVAVKEITDRIPDIEFEMITLNLDGKQLAVEKISNVLVHRIGGAGRFYKLLFPFSASRYALKLHKEKPFDAIWSIMASFSGFAALFFKKHRPKVPFLLTLQEGDSFAHIKSRVWFIYPLFKKIFRRADKIQAISNYLADWAKAMGTTCPITVIPNGVDVALFSQTPSSADVASMNFQLGKQAGDVLLITTSRLVEKNDLASLISSLTFLPENFKLAILGVGPLEMSLRNLVIELSLTDRVQFLGHVEYKEIPKYLAVADVFVRPSLSEGMGNSFIEAMAASVPVVATAVGGIPDFLKNGETGLFCEIRNPKSIAEKVKILADSRELRAHIVANAKRLVAEKYDWNLVTQEMKTLL